MPLAAAAFSSARTLPRPLGTLAFNEASFGLGELLGHRPESLEATMIDFTAIHGFAHRASRLSPMRTIVEPTVLSRGHDVGEHSAQRIFGIPQSNGSHPWRIDKNSAPGKNQQITGDRRVAPLGIPAANLLGLLHRVIQQRVNECGFARSRLAQKCSRFVRRQELTDAVQALPVHAARHHDLYVIGNGAHDVTQLIDLARLGEIRLGEHHNRGRTRIPDQYEKPL